MVESKRPKKTNAEADPLFHRFWAAFPRKVAKPEAARAFAKHRVTEETLSKILAALETQKQSDQWRKDGGKFIPHPTTWLNQRRWEDECEVINRASGVPPSQPVIKRPQDNPLLTWTGEGHHARRS